MLTQVGADGPKGAILVIDDSQIVRASMARTLADGGYRVHERSTPIGASAVIVREQIDVVVLDVEMPIMSGARFAELLQANDRLKHVGLVLITADADDSLSVDADAVLTKAQARNRLVSVIDDLLASRQEAGEVRLGIDLGRARVTLPSEGTVRIGRGGSCDILIDDADASREHAVIRTHAGQATIEDLQSRNGTRVNGEPLSEPRVLAVGDVIEIGRRELEIFDAAGVGARDKPTVTFGRGVTDG